ncbi:selenocysteine-specific translation elongation factor, partial [Microtetraspora fusca]|uniref:selenocysteine-specific translation elongation factor n=1 Tax=Microtetraspora fusca TaxID=1997 RepID=UPI001FDEBBB6
APAVMFVVAADKGWMPQSEEHLAALEALGVRHGLLAVTRADLADPGPVTAQAAARLARAGLGGAERVAVSGRTGEGLDGLRAALDRLVARLPAPDPRAPVRVWIDRVFTVRGSGTVVTGTLPAGTVAVGDELALPSGAVRVRAVECLKEATPSVTGVARVALNLRASAAPERGQALVTPGAWTWTDVVDVRIRLVGPAADPREYPAADHGEGSAAGPREYPAADHGEGSAAGPWVDGPALPPRLTAHIGSAAAVCDVRPLGGPIARLRLGRPLPLHLGDVLLLRDPGNSAAVRVLAGATVLDPRPPALRRRGAAGERAAELAEAAPDARSLMRTHRLLRAADLRAMGCAPEGAPVSGDWHADPAHWTRLRERLPGAAGRYAAEHPLEPGMPVEVARRALGLPDRRLVASLVAPPLAVRDGRIVTGPGDRAAPLPPAVAAAVERLRAELAARPFLAPEAGRLAELGLGPKEVAAAVRTGALLRVAEGVVLPAGADLRAAELLARLPQPFTVSEARRALDSSRRVMVPLLEHLDRRGFTERVDDLRRRCRTPS